MTRAVSVLVSVGAVFALVAGCKTGEDTPAGPGTGPGTVEVGSACTDDSQCSGGKCVDGGCFAATSTDGVKDGEETDVDCGGKFAPKCAPGKVCNEANDCQSALCNGGTCAAPSPTDGVKNGDESDVDCGGKTAPKCDAGKGCGTAGDCASGVCGGDKKCAAVSSTDGVKNGDETDVDCGGTAAPKCAAGKACNAPEDCDSNFCTGNVCEPRKTGRKDGDETDIDCGGKVAPKCDWGKGCLVDSDCGSAACGFNKKCVEGASCKVQYGGVTCGSGEVGQGGANHESCCRSLKVNGYTDSRQPGKQVYLDKYEITAGRMRAFIDAVSATNGGVPNIKGYMAANRPSRWVTGWENILPAANSGQIASYTVTTPSPADRLYPGQDVNASVRTQPSWNVNNGSFVIDPGLYNTLGAQPFFPEYTPDYAATHNLNCGNEMGSYGFGTYWFPANIVQTYSGGVGKKFTQQEMDVKALNCSTFGLYAAFCAWDGGQLATSEVWDYVTNNNARLGAAPNCNGINGASDTGTACPAVYFYPDDGGNTYDGAARVAPPGRVPGDTLVINAADEPWYDMKGNLLEAVLMPDNTFFYRGYGQGYGSVTHHKAQEFTPRMKAASFGARCMRFR